MVCLRNISVDTLHKGDAEDDDDDDDDNNNNNNNNNNTVDLLLWSGGIIFKDRYSRPAHSDFPKSLHVFTQELWFTVLKCYTYFLTGQEAS
jgi:hypothetical protein